MSKTKGSRQQETFLRKQARIFGRDKLALAALLIVLTYAVVAAFAPLIAPYHPEQILRDEAGKVPFLQPPSAKYLMGTTNMGRDVFSTIVYGTRTAFVVGAFTAVSITVLGTLIGISAAFFGGWVDEVLMRLTDVCLGGGVCYHPSDVAILGPCHSSGDPVVEQGGVHRGGRSHRRLSDTDPPRPSASECLAGLVDLYRSWRRVGDPCRGQCQFPGLRGSEGG